MGRVGVGFRHIVLVPRAADARGLAGARLKFSVRTRRARRLTASVGEMTSSTINAAGTAECRLIFATRACIAARARGLASARLKFSVWTRRARRLTVCLGEMTSSAIKAAGVAERRLIFAARASIAARTRCGADCRIGPHGVGVARAAGASADRKLQDVEAGYIDITHAHSGITALPTLGRRATVTKDQRRRVHSC